jgi:hypothetical protein
MPDSLVQDVASYAAALDGIDRRQDEILNQLDQLNERILRTLAENGVPAPKLPPSFRSEAKAA